MSRDLPLIGNPAEPTLHSHCFVAGYSAVDNSFRLIGASAESEDANPDARTELTLAALALSDEFVTESVEKA